ncbi:MAG TPA: TIGR00300 family protein [Bacillota bacterium]|nr:TIGR00300 family protein [Bacillota bacterium]HOL02346.1 TIGR00300 family protein [Bacillota bacterium]HPO80815.1 TIGR00300 family protein [Bacillota bacterium]
MTSTVVELTGHIIDSRSLPKVLDVIIERGGDFDIEELKVGRKNNDPSYARIMIEAESQEALDMILEEIRRLGAVEMHLDEAEVEPAPKDGVFPDNFYSSTNLETFLKIRGSWIPVDDIEMDCGIVVDFSGDPPTARCVPLGNIKKGDMVVVGGKGIKVIPLEKSRKREVFSFMGSEVSSERPKALALASIAETMKDIRSRNKKILAVVGPAVIHTGAGRHLSALIDAGYINVLFGGNAVATHDVEWALLGTSLGVYLDTGIAAPAGHTHHIKAINTIRKYGSFEKAVEAGVLTKGIMYSCVKNGIDYVLAGSIRDDGPMPGVITDSAEAQDAMRRCLKDVELALMLSTMLHSIATGNLLPGRVKTVCVDINPATVTKLVDRGSHQAVGVVSDVELFLKELANQLIG